MKIPIKKLVNGFELPVYGLGMSRMAGHLTPDTTNDEENIKAINMVIEAGVTHIDTAEMYGAGHAEVILGRAIQGLDRSKLTIATKVSPENHSYDDLRRSFDSSLKRIGTDYIDLYMLHFYPIKGSPISEAMRAMNDLVSEGLVKHVGVSNFSPRRVNEAQKYSDNKIVCNQVHYNLKFREAEHSGALKQCQDDDIFLVAWRAIQKDTLARNKLIDEIAEKYGKTHNQIAINWLISQKNVVTISKTNNPEHLKENLGALDWVMDDEDIERIRREYPDQLAKALEGTLEYEGDISF